MVSTLLRIILSDKGMIQPIMKTLEQYKGIKEVYQSGTSISAFANWTNSEIAEKTKKIRSIAGIEDVEARVLTPV
jgi:hypothetical protein